ncbi:SurA N-terminal domain-containing protein [soil metagenome]
MFEYIRTHQRLMQFLLLLVILPSFALFGLSSYTSMGNQDAAVAKVAGQTITQQEWDAAVRDQIERFREKFPGFDQKMFDSPSAKMNVLENLIAQRAMVAEAARNNLTVTDQGLQQAILAIPGIKTEDGRFDRERYKSLLEFKGMTPAMYESQLRKDLTMQQLNAAIQSSAFAPKYVASRLSDLNDQERSVQEMVLKTADFLKQVQVSDDMLKKYYEQNSRQFEIPDQVKAEYVVLKADDIATQVSVSDADVKKVYEDRVKPDTNPYTVNEQRRASHILITVKKGASDADKAAAKAKAETLHAQVTKSPAEFAKLAKENSQDPGSAERGGDLDYFSKGMMVKPFEAAAFKLKQGEISGVVESDFGFHIIQLTDIKPAKIKAFDEVKAEIASEIKKQQATTKYSEVAELLRNAAEETDSMKAVVDKLADKVKLKVETAANLTRQPNPAVAPTMVFNNAKFLTALFTDDAVKNKRNTEVVEVMPSTLVVGHVIDYKPASKRPFEEVQPLLRDMVAQAEAKKLVKKAGEAKLAELKAKDDASGFGEVKTLSRAKSEGIDRTAVPVVMKADVSKLPAYVGVDIPGQGYGVYRLSKVTQPASVDLARRLAEQQQVTTTLSQQEMLAYLEVLKQKAKVKILKAPATAAQGQVQGAGDS